MKNDRPPTNLDRFKAWKAQASPTDHAFLFRQLGFAIEGKSPNADGWINDLRIGPDDRNASAGVNVNTGRIKDFGGRGEGDAVEFIKSRDGVTAGEAAGRALALVSSAGDGANGPAAILTPGTPRTKRDPIDARSIERWAKALAGAKAGPAARALEYLTSRRGLRPETIAGARIGFTVYPKDKQRPDVRFWVTFPVHQHEGGGYTVKRVAFDPDAGAWLRDDGGKKIERTWGGGSCLYLIDQAETDARPVLIVEGEIDALTARQEGHNAISGTGGAGTVPAGAVEIIAGLPGARERVTLCFDADRAGLDGARKWGSALAARIERERLFIATLPDGEDVNSLHASGRGAELASAIEGAAPYRAGDGVPAQAMATPAAQASPDDEGRMFWTITRGGVQIEPNRLIEHIHGLGFNKAYIGGINTSAFIRTDGNILSEVSAEQIKDAVKHSIKDRAEDRVKSKLYGAANVYFGRATLEFLDELRPDFHRSTRGSAFFYYENGFVTVTENGPILRPYSEMPGHIWAGQRIARPFRPLDFSNDAVLAHLWEFEFMRFWRLAMRAGEQLTPRLRALLSAVGYAIHDYKDPATAKAIILNDETISDDPEGRGGKSLTVHGLGKMVPAVHLDGRSVDFSRPFVFQSVTPAHRIIHFNDCRRDFPFESCFSMITDALDIEGKNRPRINIPFKDAPKFILSTNYVIPGKGGSVKARVHEIEFSDYFNSNYTPVHEFGRRFFEDWADTDWTLFDNMMMWCVTLYLREGLTSYNHVSLSQKRFVQNTSREFADYVEFFAGDLVPGRHIAPGRHLEKFRDGDTASGYDGNGKFSKLSPQAFKKWLKEYADLRGWGFRDRDEAGERLRDSNGQYVEFVEGAA